MQDLRVATGIFVMYLNERVYPVRGQGTSEPVIVVIEPKYDVSNGGSCILTRRHQAAP